MNEKKDFESFGYFCFTSVIIFLFLLGFYHDTMVSFIVAIFCYVFLRFTNFFWNVVKKILGFFIGGGFIGRGKKD